MKRFTMFKKSSLLALLLCLNISTAYSFFEHFPVHFYKLKHNDAKMVTQIIQEVLKWDIKNHLITITLVPLSNSLLIVASPENYPLIKKLLDQLDQPLEKIKIEVCIPQEQDLEQPNDGF